MIFWVVCWNVWNNTFFLLYFHLYYLFYIMACGIVDSMFNSPQSIVIYKKVLVHVWYGFIIKNVTNDLPKKTPPNKQTNKKPKKLNFVWKSVFHFNLKDFQVWLYFSVLRCNTRIYWVTILCFYTCTYIVYIVTLI